MSRVLRRVERGEADLLVEQAYAKHWGKACVGVDWSTWALDDMKVGPSVTRQAEPGQSVT